jgi:hypothetical protein
MEKCKEGKVVANHVAISPLWPRPMLKKQLTKEMRDCNNFSLFIYFLCNLSCVYTFFYQSNVFPISFTTYGTTPWISDQSDARILPTQDNKTDNGQTYMHSAGLEPEIQRTDLRPSLPLDLHYLCVCVCVRARARAYLTK